LTSLKSNSTFWAAWLIHFPLLSDAENLGVAAR
jgi:hypothetical protein